MRYYDDENRKHDTTTVRIREDEYFCKYIIYLTKTKIKFKNKTFSRTQNASENINVRLYNGISYKKCEMAYISMIFFQYRIEEHTINIDK
jgi:hypothetical protein